MKQKKKKKESPEEFAAARLDELESKYGTEAANPKILKEIKKKRSERRKQDKICSRRRCSSSSTRGCEADGRP